MDGLVKIYLRLLQEAINNVIDVDIPTIENIEFKSRHKLKNNLSFSVKFNF
jgi:hypothetical protein